MSSFYYQTKFDLLKFIFRTWLFRDVEHLRVEDFMENPDKFLVIDCREQVEYQTSSIENSINLPGFHIKKSDIEELLDSRPVLFYCSIGYRSSLAARNFRTEFPERQVFNLNGGLFEFANLGYRQGDGKTKVHGYNEKWSKLLKSELKYL